MADAVKTVHDHLGGFESLNLFLEDGANEVRPRGDEATEAEGIGEIIFGSGVQVSTHTFPMADSLLPSCS